MSREYYETMDLYHRDLADSFRASEAGKSQHVECRIDDQIYVYLYADGTHIQTQHVDIPDRWMEHWPSEPTVRRYIRQQLDLGRSRITTLDA